MDKKKNETGGKEQEPLKYSLNKNVNTVIMENKQKWAQGYQ